MQNSVAERVSAILAELLDIELSKITPESRLSEDLGADSLDAIELMMAFEDQFGVQISDEEAESMKTVSDIVDMIEEAQPAAN